MKYELSGKQKRLEFDIFIEAISSNKLQYYSKYGQDYNYDDKITKRSDTDNWYDGEQKFNELVENTIKKLKLLKIKHILNKEIIKEKYESGFREYERPHYIYDFLMTDLTFEYRYAHLSYEERAFCSLEIVFLMMMHNMKVEAFILSNVFGFEVTKQVFYDIRNDISEVLNCEIEKNHRGRYKIIKK